MSKTKRIDHRDCRPLQKLFKEIDKLRTEFREWKEKICKIPEVNCYPDQLRELEGRIYEDDCRWSVGLNGERILTEGVTRRLSKELFQEAIKFRDGIVELQKKLQRRTETVAIRYGTFADLINPTTGELVEFDRAPTIPDPEEESSDSSLEKSKEPSDLPLEEEEKNGETETQ